MAEAQRFHVTFLKNLEGNWEAHTNFPDGDPPHSKIETGINLNENGKPQTVWAAVTYHEAKTN